MNEFLIPGSSSAPAIVAAYPPDGTNGIDAQEGIWVLFDQQMDEQQTERAFVISGPSGRINGSISWINSQRMSFQPSSPLTEAGEYFIVVSNTAESASGVDLQDEYRAAFSLSADTVRPDFVSSNPPNGAQGVSIDSQIILNFSEGIDFSSLQSGLNLSPDFLYTVNLSSDGRTVTITPSADLVSGLQYTLTITNSIKDIQGNTISNPQSISFFTGSDFLAPTINSVSIGAITLIEGLVTENVERTDSIRITFSEPMNQLATESNIEISPSFDYSTGWNVAGDTIEIIPQSPLLSEENYTLSIFDNASDLAGNTLNEQINFSFLTNGLNSTHPIVISVQQDRSNLPGGVDGAVRATNYFAAMVDYGFADISHTVDINPDPGLTEALVFRVLFDKNMKLTSLLEAISFIPVLNTGGSSLTIHSLQYGISQNEIILHAAWIPSGVGTPVYALQISTDARDINDNRIQERFRRYISF